MRRLNLSFGRKHADPLRITPQHGPPTCLVETTSQWIWHHRVILYTAAMTTLVATLQLLDIHIR